jgi:hypothetical protein
VGDCGGGCGVEGAFGVVEWCCGTGMIEKVLLVVELKMFNIFCGVVVGCC